MSAPTGFWVPPMLLIVLSVKLVSAKPSRQLFPATDCAEGAWARSWLLSCLMHSEPLPHSYSNLLILSDGGDKLLEVTCILMYENRTLIPLEASPVACSTGGCRMLGALSLHFSHFLLVLSRLGRWLIKFFHYWKFIPRVPWGKL